MRRYDVYLCKWYIWRLSRGVAAAIGISSGVLVHVGMAALGLAVLLLTYLMAYNIIRYLGGLYLLLLAVQSRRLCGD